jgi:predicted TIM-barrel fold metal-dependent hydrolase
MQERTNLEFALNPADYGLPTREELRKLRIWDDHYHGFMGRDPIRQHEQMMFYVERMGVERVIALDIAGAGGDPFQYSADVARQERQLLERDKDRVSGIIRIDPTDPDRSVKKMEEWIADGPCIGIKYVGGNRGGLTCSHPNNDPIIRKAAELKAVVYIHTWLKIGGKPRHVGGGNLRGESTPMDVVQLAQRFPDHPLICGHSGGDWEIGIRTIRPYKNIYLEFAGSDSHSGEVDLAVKELGVDRIVWGGHGPSRSFATEMSKVLDADLDEAGRMQVFGGNLRRIAAPIFRSKGYTA